MRRFVKRFCLFLIPFLVVGMLFFAFEPYDYIGLRGDASYLSMPLSSMRELMQKKPSRIILGDSKMANLNTDYIRELTGKDYQMLGFGGSSIGECIELFWFATEHTELEEVVFGLSFYMTRHEYNAGRIPDIEQRATNVFRFAGDFRYWLEAVNAAKEKAFNLAGDLLDRPDWITVPEDPTGFDLAPAATVPDGEPYGDYFEFYARQRIYPMCEGYYIDDDMWDALQAVIDYCDQSGVELTFVFTPTHESIYQYVIEPLGIDATDQLKAFVLGKANVIDMELHNDFTADDANFYDGFHLTGPNKKLLAQWIFTDTPSEYVVRYYK